MRRLLPLLALAALLAGGEDEALRDQLRSGAPPWYDAASDGWRRVEPRKPDPPPEKSERAESSSGGGIPVDLIAWALVATAAAAIVVLVIRAWRTAGDGALPPPDDRRVAGSAVDLSALTLPEGTIDVEASLAAARARGDWGNAVILLYARLLLRLGGAGVVVLMPGTTNRAYCRTSRAWAGEGAGRDAVPTAMERLSGACEAVRFGHEPADAARFAGLERLEAEAATALARVAR